MKMYTFNKITDYPKYKNIKPADFLPTNLKELESLGESSCDIIIVTGDAYVDHPSFGMAIIGRFLESFGLRVGVISQPNWQTNDDFLKLGTPNLFFGVTSGNMDSMINHYTADKKKRNDDAYTPDAKPNKRPDMATIVYTQKLKQLFKNTPVIIGGIEASLRRLAHYDYWSDKVRRSILVDSAADMLFFGNAEKALSEFVYQIMQGKSIKEITNIRGTALVLNKSHDFKELDLSRMHNFITTDVNIANNPYDTNCKPNEKVDIEEIKNNNEVVRLPSYEKLSNDKPLYAHTSRIFHQETNPFNARRLIQKHANVDVFVNAPAIPLATDEMDYVFSLPFQRVPSPQYKNLKIPAYDMIKTSVNIMRGCFGGCSFCSITEHEGKIIQNRSKESILHEIKEIQKTVQGFTGVISDIGGPTANMYNLGCKYKEVEEKCRRLSCVYPSICVNLNTDHSKLIELYKEARKISGIKKILIASGVRYDLALLSPAYIEELVMHHVGGYLKIAPEHTQEDVLTKMLKPRIEVYDAFKRAFDIASKKAKKEQYLIPYFIAAHPGSTTKDMINTAVWLKKNNFKLDQVQTFYPSPMSLATAMYYSGKNPLKKVNYKTENVYTAKSWEDRQIQKILLRYHDSKNEKILKEILLKEGFKNLIGTHKDALVCDTVSKKHKYKNSKR